MDPRVTGIPCGSVVECQATRPDAAVVTQPLARVRTRGGLRPWRWRSWGARGRGRSSRSEVPGHRRASAGTVGHGLMAGKKLLEGAIHDFRDGGTFEVGLLLNHAHIALGDMVGVQLRLPCGVLSPLEEGFPGAPPSDEVCEIAPHGAEFLQQCFITRWCHRSPFARGGHERLIRTKYTIIYR